MVEGELVFAKTVKQTTSMPASGEAIWVPITHVFIFPV